MLEQQAMVVFYLTDNKKRLHSTKGLMDVKLHLDCKDCTHMLITVTA